MAKATPKATTRTAEDTELRNRFAGDILSGDDVEYKTDEERDKAAESYFAMADAMVKASKK